MQSSLEIDPVTPLGGFQVTITIGPATGSGTPATRSARDRAVLANDLFDDMLAGTVRLAGQSRAFLRQADTAAGRRVAVFCIAVSKACPPVMASAGQAPRAIVPVATDRADAGGMERRTHAPSLLRDPRGNTRSAPRAALHALRVCDDGCADRDPFTGTDDAASLFERAPHARTAA